MNKLYSLSVIFALTLFLFTTKANAQSVDLTLKYNINNNRYEVYAKSLAPSFNFNWGLSKITVVTPASFSNQSLQLVSHAAGQWVNNASVFAPTISPNFNYHSLESTGQIFNLLIYQETLIVSFVSPTGTCISGLRLFVNGSDPNSSQPGMNGIDFSNSINNVTVGEAYNTNYNNNGIICNSNQMLAIDDYVFTQSDVPLSIFPLTNDLNLQNTTWFIMTNPISGTFVYFANQAVYSPNQNFSGTDSFTYGISEINNPTTFSTATVYINVASNITSDRLKLIAFYDTNNNGIQDAGEITCNNGHFVAQYNPTTNMAFYESPSYVYFNNPTQNYNLSYTTNNNGFDVCSTTYSNVSIAAGSGETTYYFPVTITTPYTDLGIYSSNFTLVPGFNQNCNITYRNNGNQVIPSGTITFTKDAALSISSITQTGTVATPTGFTYDFTNLLPGETRYINVQLQVPNIPTVSLGQLVTNSATITPTDSYLSNNTSIRTTVIVGAYDPNDITEAHGEEIVHSTFSSNDYLTYTIRFENTGTANAINVKVEDILNSKLDETSVRMIGSSHANVLKRFGSNLTWSFDDIQLPPSVPNSQTGHGFIVFEVKPKAGYAIGDIIPNTANIFFDFNPAIVTNTWNTEFVTALNTENFIFNDLKSYPNPVKDNLFVSNNSKIDKIEIISILGQKVISKNINSLSTEIDLSGISKGIYFVKIKSNNQEKTIKIIKE